MQKKSNIKFEELVDVSRAGALLTLLFGLLLPVLSFPALAQSRRLEVGEKAPAFSVTTLDGKEFEYDEESKKVLLICFMSAGQTRSKNAVEDLMKLTANPMYKPERMDLLLVFNKRTDIKLTGKDSDKQNKIVPKMVVDKGFKLWGKFGIIALPTVMIIDADHKIAWAGPGYSYDFYGHLKAELNRALGIGQEIDPEQLEKVRTAANNSTEDKIARNIQMANALKEKGKYKTALMIAKKAGRIDPESAEVIVFIGELYCLSDDPNSALAAVENVSSDKEERSVRSKVSLIKGWANRKLQNHQKAEEYLAEAVKLNPRSVRSYYELGNLYRQTGRDKKAAEAYHYALELILGK